MSRNQTTWVVILFVALALRLGAAAWWQSRLGAEARFFFGDSHGYWELARTIAAGEPYQYLSPDAQVFRAPGYPLLLAGLFRLFGGEPPVLAARALGAALGTASVGIVGWWTSRLFNARAGRIAGWIAALYPGGISLSVFVLSEAPFVPLMLLQLALWGAAWRAKTTRSRMLWGAAAGVAGGLASLTRPSWLLFVPFAVAVGLMFASERRRQLTIGLAMAAAVCVCMAPWWVRNWQVTGRFVPTTLQVGASLYDGLNPRASGGSDMSFVPEIVAAERRAEAEANGASSETFEYRLDRRMRDAAEEFAREHPRRVAELAWIKLVRIWNVWPNEPAFRSWPLRLVVLATYGPLLVLGLVGVWRYSRRGWPYVVAWLPAVYLTLLHVVFVGSMRYREPAMLAVMPLAAGVRAPPERDAELPPGKAGG